MQLERRQEGLFMHQENFANKTLAKCNMTDCKIMKTPLAPSSTEDKMEAKVMNFPYRKYGKFPVFFKQNQTRSFICCEF